MGVCILDSVHFMGCVSEVSVYLHMHAEVSKSKLVREFAKTRNSAKKKAKFYLSMKLPKKISKIALIFVLNLCCNLFNGLPTCMKSFILHKKKIVLLRFFQIYLNQGNYFQNLLKHYY